MESSETQGVRGNIYDLPCRGQSSGFQQAERRILANVSQNKEPWNISERTITPMGLFHLCRLQLNWQGKGNQSGFVSTAQRSRSLNMTGYLEKNNEFAECLTGLKHAILCNVKNERSLHKVNRFKARLIF